MHEGTMYAMKPNNKTHVPWKSTLAQVAVGGWVWREGELSM